MGKVFTPYQQNWQFWENDAAEPTTNYAAENTTFTMSTYNEILRLRATIAETGDATANDILTIEYSVNDVDFTAFGAANHWNYADGLATEGNDVTGLKLADSDTNGEYHESGTNTATYAKSTNTELDAAYQATANVTASTVYYFRLKLNGAIVPLNSGETHPYLTTASVIPDGNVMNGYYYKFLLGGLVWGVIG